MSFALNKNAEIIFARQFKSQKESLLHRPYTMYNLPLTAEKAITRLTPGDFVAFEGKINLIVSLGIDTVQGHFDLGASTHAFLSGNFIVHLFRMKDNKMRVKLIGVRSNGLGANAGIGIDDFEVVGMRLIDNRLEKWLSFTPLKADAGLRKNDVVMLDYVFALDNPTAAQAYDSLMQNKVILKDIKILNPTASRHDLTQTLLADLTDVEEVAVEDVSLPVEQKRIERIFKGSSEGLHRDAKTRFALTFFRFEAGRAYGQNKVLSYDAAENPQYFLLDTFAQHKKSKLLFGLFGDETLVTSNLLFTTDESWKPERFLTLTSGNEMKIRDLSAKDFREIQKIVHETLGENHFTRIPWNQWDNTKNKRINAYFKQEVFFNPQALSSLPQMSEELIAENFKTHLKQKGPPRSYPGLLDKIPKNMISNWVSFFTGDIRKVAQNLELIISPQTTVETRLKAFEELQKIELWRERGLGFLISLIPENKQHSMFRYKMVLTAKDEKPLIYEFGYFAEEKIYQALMYIQNIIHNRSFDMRLFREKGDGSQLTVNSPY